jgi:hypothetical protein
MRYDHSLDLSVNFFLACEFGFDFGNDGCFATPKHRTVAARGLGRPEALWRSERFCAGVGAAESRPDESVYTLRPRPAPLAEAAVLNDCGTSPFACRRLIRDALRAHAFQPNVSNYLCRFAVIVALVSTSTEQLLE